MKDQETKKKNLGSNERETSLKSKGKVIKMTVAFLSEFTC
jgi:hypothetical protein